MPQKPLRRVPIEEVGIDDREETRMFEQRLETETRRNVVRRDLDEFDAWFASGDGATTGHAAVTDTTPATNISERSTSMKKSDIHGATKNVSLKLWQKCIPKAVCRFLSNCL